MRIAKKVFETGLQGGKRESILLFKEYIEIIE